MKNIPLIEQNEWEQIIREVIEMEHHRTTAKDISERHPKLDEEQIKYVRVLIAIFHNELLLEVNDEHCNHASEN